ncbi:MAG TPA: DegT/DnrJ/EryC1/StrS family aminotransferase [Pirellulales bacterium]|nr:DegT/DnrJ/EryC1/StrS family aminotransferase [Pirellulales bacterium]
MSAPSSHDASSTSTVKRGFSPGHPQSRSAHLPPPAGVPLIDISRHNAQLENELAAALARVSRSGRFVLGPDCQDLESGIAAFCQARHAIACASGSDALVLALMAYEIGPGDEVIVPSFTFFATASAVSRLGARPVFVDIDPASYNLDPALVAAAVTPATKAVIAVHLYGQCADMAPLVALARRHRLAVIEDACQAIGAEYRGRRAGVLGDVACFSFYPTKNLGGWGDGGMLTTEDDVLADKLRLLRVHGMQPRYHHQLLGINSRLDTLQAAVLNVKLPHLEGWTAQRQRLALRYGELLRRAKLDGALGLPAADTEGRHVWNQYVVRVPGGRRDSLREHLAGRRIGTEIYYPVPLHRQPCFASLGYREGSLPETERAARETLALPIFPELTAAEQSLVVEEIAAYFKRQQSVNASVLAGPKFLKYGTRTDREG